MFKPFSSVWDGKEKERGFKTRVFLYYLVYLIFRNMIATPARQVTPACDVYMANCHPGWQGYPIQQTGQPVWAGHPTYHVNVIKIK